MYVRNPYLADKIIGFLIPLGLFLEVGSPILLATSPLAQEGFAFPLSILALPLALILGLSRISTVRVYPPWIKFLTIAFTLYCLTMSTIYAVIYAPTAFLYGIQWCLVFLWMFYLSSIHEHDRFVSFIKAFVIGSTFTILYYFASGVLEYLLYGGLQDGGRLSQNLILPGQYQIAVSIPTLISYSAIIINICHYSGVYIIRKFNLYIINAAAAGALVFCAAREALLVVVAYLTIMLLADGGGRRYAAFVLLFALGLIAINPSPITEIFADSEFRLLTKLASLDDSDKYLGGRDTMIEDVLSIIKDNPLFGTFFLPPNSEILFINANAPSAHNMYVDAFLWSGLLGGVLYLAICLLLVVLSVRRVAAPHADYLGRHAGIALIVFLLVSNNLNVPMRQPAIAPMLAVLIYICAYWSSARQEGAPRAEN